MEKLMVAMTTSILLTRQQQAVQLKTEPRRSSSFNGLLFCPYNRHAWRNLAHIGIGAVNDFLQLSDMLEFEGTETRGHHILNFRHLSYDFFPIYVSTTEILYTEPYCILTNKIKSFIHSFTCVTQGRLNWTARQMRRNSP